MWPKQFVLFCLFCLFCRKIRNWEHNSLKSWIIKKGILFKSEQVPRMFRCYIKTVSWNKLQTKQVYTTYENVESLRAHVFLGSLEHVATSGLCGNVTHTEEEGADHKHTDHHPDQSVLHEPQAARQQQQRHQAASMCFYSNHSANHSSLFLHCHLF